MKGTSPASAFTLSPFHMKDVGEHDYVSPFFKEEELFLISLSFLFLILSLYPSGPGHTAIDFTCKVPRLSHGRSFL